jgi:hypothetical protein
MRVLSSRPRRARALRRHSLKRGSRECRMRAAPAVSCAKLCKETHTSIQVQRRQSGIPCAMALRLMPCSPRRRIPLVTVAAGLMALRSGWTDIATDSLTPATGARTTRFCRTQPPVFAKRLTGLRRRSSGTSRSLTENRPAISSTPDAAASTTSHPNVRDDGRLPSCGMRRRWL